MIRAVVTRILGPAAVDRLRRARRAIGSFLVRAFSRGSIAPLLYYTFVNGAFRREQAAVLAGRAEFLRASQRIGRSSALLRRNVHRVEKGLVMRPRREFFAEDFIGHTVECYARCVTAGTLERGELLWARDVLTKYFATVRPTPPIARAGAHFASITQPRDEGEPGSGLRLPYRHGELPPSPIGFSAFMGLCRRRRSVRWFKPHPIRLELLEQAAAAAAQSPSACNRQPLAFRLILDRKMVTAVARLAGGTVGLAEGFPALAVLLGDLSSFRTERDRHLIYIDGGLAAMTFMLALETLGLSSCPINWPDIEARERKAVALLALPAHLRIVMLIAIGHADEEGLIPYSQKKDLIELQQPFELGPNA
jgi:nitroreductase